MFLVGGALALWLTPQGPASPPPSEATLATTDGPGRFGLYTLAISWEPAFCETAPGKPECRSLTQSRYDADHFALHGLWPQDEYCGVSDALIRVDTNSAWGDLPDLALTQPTRMALERIMPGTQSELERHEWIKHGTCAGVSAESYYARAIALVDAVNASAVRDLFADNLGQRITRNQIRAAFDTAFGNRAGERVRGDCADDGNRTLVSELRIRLYGDVMSAASISSLLAAATPGGTGCDTGLVDRAGNG